MNRSQQSDMEDRILIRNYLSGDTDSFQILYARHKTLLYNYLNRILNFDRTLADDLFQQTWIRALDHLPGYRDQKQFPAWLLRIAHNLVMDHYRKSRIAQQFGLDSSVRVNMMSAFHTTSTAVNLTRALTRAK